MTSTLSSLFVCLFFFFNDTATTEIYTLSLHDALPICHRPDGLLDRRVGVDAVQVVEVDVVDAQPLERALDRAADVLGRAIDRKSTRLNSSHANISNAVFCLKKKKSTKLPRTNNHSSEL